MKVYHIQYGTSPAGNAAYRLHKAMIDNGIDSRILTYVSIKKIDRVQKLKTTIKSLMLKYLNKLFSKHRYKGQKAGTYYFSALPILGDNRIVKIIKDADVIYIHWIGGFVLSKKNIEEIASLGKPVIFFMHDAFTFTGGCHHFFDCKKYLSGCNDCLMFNNSNIAHKQAIMKKALFTKYPNLYFVSPSRWLEDCAKNSYVLKDCDVRCINNYIDENQFQPINKAVARQCLGLPQDKFIISFGTQGGGNKTWKGWNFLRDAINNTNFSDVLLVIFGSDYEENIVKELKYPCWFSGQLMDENSLILLDNAVDLHVSPSLAESYGMTFIENALCGTPVIGFDCTAVPECVNSQTGLLAKFKDVKDLTNCIISIHDNGFKPTLRDNYKSSEILDKHLLLIKEAQKNIH